MSARRRAGMPPAPRAPLVLPRIPSLAARLLCGIMVGALMLAGCGQMGPLVLPGEADQGTGDEAAAASSPDATAEGEREGEAEGENEGGAGE